MNKRTESLDVAVEYVRAALTWRRSVIVDVEAPKGRHVAYVVREAATEVPE